MNQETKEKDKKRKDLNKTIFSLRVLIITNMVMFFVIMHSLFFNGFRLGLVLFSLSNIVFISVSQFLIFYIRSKHSRILGDFYDR